MSTIEQSIDAEITEQEPDQRIAWTNAGQPKAGGLVTFHRIDGDLTRVMLQLDFEPEGLVEKAGDALGIVKSRTKGDLERFKEFIAARATETGPGAVRSSRAPPRSSHQRRLTPQREHGARILQMHRSLQL